MINELVAELIATLLIFTIYGLITKPIGQKWVFRNLLKIYPRPFRRRYGDEMLDVFLQKCHATAQENGAFGIVIVFLKENSNLIKNATHSRIHYTLMAFLVYITLLLALIAPIATMASDSEIDDGKTRRDLDRDRVERQREILKLLREDDGNPLSIPELAQRLSVSQSTVLRWIHSENSETKHKYHL